MKNTRYIFLIFLSVGLVFLASCKKSSEKKLKVGLVSSVGGFQDRGFNQLALMGLTRAEQKLSVTVESRECFDTASIRQNIQYFVQQDFDLIITLGYASANPVLTAARNNPDIKFAILDYVFDNPPANLQCYVYRVDQSAFLCGFLGAYWAQLKDSQNPVAGWIGGPEIPEIQHFHAGFTSGVSYFNSIYQQSVQWVGGYSNTFNDTIQGAKMADSLIGMGADLIFPFAGKTGNGALYKIKELNKWAIGVDIDQYVSIPEVSGILITSCLKNLDKTVFEIINKTSNGNWGTIQVNYGSLSTGDVDLASFHNFETAIPDSIKNKLTEIRTEINAGTITTGWNP